MLASTSDAAPAEAGLERGTNPCASGAPRPGDFEPKDDTRWLVSCPPNSAAETAARAALVKAYQPEPGNRVEVRFGCTPMSAVEAVYYEYDNYPAPETWLFRRQQDGRFSVLRFQYNRHLPSVTLRVGDEVKVVNKRFQLSRGMVDGRRMQRVISLLRAYIGAQVREVEPLADKSRQITRHAALSGDEGHFVQLVGAGGNIAQRQFSGGSNNRNAGERIPMELIAAELGPVRSEATKPGTEFTDDERRYLSKWLYWNRFGGEAVPNVRAARRVVRVASRIRWRESIPALLTAIQFAPYSESERETHDAALNLLAALTQWDARKGPDGKLRPRNQVTRDYIVSCSALWNIRVYPDSLPSVDNEHAH